MSTFGPFRAPASSEELPLWELLHENSKITRFDRSPSNEVILEHMAATNESLRHDGCPRAALEAPLPLNVELGAALSARISARGLSMRGLTFAELGSLLFYSYGVNRAAATNAYGRGLRCVPSAGALYPLELYFHTSCTTGVPSGVHHYEPLSHEIERVRSGDQTRDLAACFVQPALVSEASLIVIITGLFERTTAKYGERGYRFALLEAGHVAQNLCLAAGGLGLGSVTLGGFFDAALDGLLALDGIDQSALYAVAVGGPGGSHDAKAT